MTNAKWVIFETGCSTVNLQSLYHKILDIIITGTHERVMPLIPTVCWHRWLMTEVHLASKMYVYFKSHNSFLLHDLIQPALAPEN